MKVARPVWGGGKGGDNFKALPITIGSFYKNEQCCGSGFQRFPEGYGYAYEDPVYQRKKSGNVYLSAKDIFSDFIEKIFNCFLW